MGVFQRLFNFYINSSIHVALAVSAFTAISFIVFNARPSFDLLGFIFLGSITGYNFVKYAGIAQLQHRSLTEGLKIIQVFSLICFAGLVYFTVQVGWTILLACIPLGLLTLFYAVPLGPKNTNLRTTPSLKIFVIAAVWAGVSVYLPAVFLEKPVDFSLILLLFQRFLIVLALIIPFELRDLHYDNSCLATLPQILGTKKVKVLAYFLLLLAVLLSFLGDYSSNKNVVFTVVMALAIALAILCATLKQSRYYASFWVEGIPVFYWLGWQIIQIWPVLVL